LPHEHFLPDGTDDGIVWILDVGVGINLAPEETACTDALAGGRSGTAFVAKGVKLSVE